MDLIDDCSSSNYRVETRDGAIFTKLFGILYFTCNPCHGEENSNEFVVIDFVDVILNLVYF